MSPAGVLAMFVPSLKVSLIKGYLVVKVGGCPSLPPRIQILEGTVA